MSRATRYPQEIRERAVRMVFEHEPESYKAVIRVGAPGKAYSALVAETRRIAGPQISRGRDQPSA